MFFRKFGVIGAWESRCAHPSHWNSEGLFLSRLLHRLWSPTKPGWELQQMPKKQEWDLLFFGPKDNSSPVSKNLASAPHPDWMRYIFVDQSLGSTTDPTQIQLPSCAPLLYMSGKNRRLRWLQMNGMKFKTSGNLPIILEESIEYTSLKWIYKAKLEDFNMEPVGFRITRILTDSICPNNFPPGHCAYIRLPTWHLVDALVTCWLRKIFCKTSYNLFATIY